MISTTDINRLISSSDISHRYQKAAPIYWYQLVSSASIDYLTETWRIFESRACVGKTFLWSPYGGQLHKLDLWESSGNMWEYTQCGATLPLRVFRIVGETWPLVTAFVRWYRSGSRPLMEVHCKMSVQNLANASNILLCQKS